MYAPSDSSVICTCARVSGAVEGFSYTWRARNRLARAQGCGGVRKLRMMAEVNAAFVELPAFERHRAEYLDDEGFRALQNQLLANPEAGDVIMGTGGLRKVRLADPRRGKGKRGGLRLPRRAKRAEGAHQGRVGSTEEAMKKKANRRFFTELTEGFEALATERAGKVTLRTHQVKSLPAPTIGAAELVRVRKRLRLSRPVFAAYLRTNLRTLENWEQGRAKPNAQATLLIKMVEKFPDTVSRLAAI